MINFLNITKMSEEYYKLVEAVIIKINDFNKMESITNKLKSFESFEDKI